jgi:hypothetical protein
MHDMSAVTCCVQIQNIELIFSELTRLHKHLQGDELVESVLEDIVEVEWEHRRRKLGADEVVHLSLDKGDPSIATGTQERPYRTLAGVQAGVQDRLAQPTNTLQGLLVLVSSDSGRELRRKVLVRVVPFAGKRSDRAYLLPATTDAAAGCEHGAAETSTRVHLQHVHGAADTHLQPDQRAASHSL